MRIPCQFCHRSFQVNRRISAIFVTGGGALASSRIAGTAKIAGRRARSERLVRETVIAPAGSCYNNAMNPAEMIRHES